MSSRQDIKGRRYTGYNHTHLRISPVDRIMARVIKAPGPLSTDCWLTTFALDRNGYVSIKIPVGNLRSFAHRILFEHFVSEIPDGLELDHLCRVRSCVNPTHLEAVTHKENMRRGMAPNIVTFRTGICRNGHSMEDAYVWGGKQRCRPCATQHQREYRARRAA